MDISNAYRFAPERKGYNSDRNMAEIKADLFGKLAATAAEVEANRAHLDAAQEALALTIDHLDRAGLKNVAEELRPTHKLVQARHQELAERAANARKDLGERKNNYDKIRK
jgi:hypothetical protein